MKKLLIGLFAAASASIAAHASPISGTSFEGVALKDFGGSADGAIAVNSDDAGVSGNPSYWAYANNSTTEKVGWFTNRTDNAEGQWGAFENPGYIWGENKIVGLPDISGGNFANDEKYLKLDANTRINRLISLNGGTSEDMDGVYFDAMVQFTPTYEMPDLDNADKIAVWLYGSDGDDGIKDGNGNLIEGTNIVVTAGFINGSYPDAVGKDENGNYGTNTTNYFTTTEIEPNTWHRVTIKAIKKISSQDSAGGPVSGFVVFIDGVAVATAPGVAREDVEGSTPVFNALTSVAQNYNSKNALFPSRAIDTTISLAGFIGTGALDDVSFTKDAPAFDQGPTGFTVSWPATLTSLTVDTDPDDETAGSTPQGFVAGTAGSYTYELESGSKFTIEANPSDGNMIVVWKYGDETISDSEKAKKLENYSPVESGTLQIVVAPIVAKIGNTEYPDFTSALNGAVNGDTIEIANDTIFNSDEWTAPEIAKTITIDLCGKTLESLVDNDFVFVVAEGGIVTVVSSVAGGTIKRVEETDNEEGAIVVSEGGSLIIGSKSADDTGVTIDGLINNSGSLSIVRGSFSSINYAMGYLDSTDETNYAVATGSEVTGPDEGGFYTVAPATAALTIQITSADTTYNQAAQRPEYVVKQGDTTISADDYTIAWTKDGDAIASPSFIEAGAYEATVTYEGATATATYTIAPLSIAEASVTFETAAYTGSAITPAVKSISVGGLTVPVADVEASSSETIQNVGEYTVTITAIGSNYTGSTTATFAISQKTVTATVQLAKYEDYYEEGLELPKVTSIGFGGDKLVENTDYTMAWDKNAITEPKESAEIYTLTVSPVVGSNFTFDSVTATYKVKQTTPDTGKYVGPGGGEFTIPAEATVPTGKKWSDTVTVAGTDITYAQAYALGLEIDTETGAVSGTIKTSIKVENGKVVLDIEGAEGYTFTAKFFKSTNLAAENGGWSEEASINSGAAGGEDAGTQAFYKVSITTITINDAKAE